ncbi:uncharacterized protein LOC132198209 [Neocloeon triangulifer]|uniref:uncharacterized protein LOC132198209 n=1 Tax=Neocloeon triangulifer TaxID=2078957 RepID=UPI00286FA324|nr:uncharacterized protein LOC132198209 [Neocloeon triangulifer]
MKFISKLFTLFVVLGIALAEDYDDIGAVRAVVKLPTNCKETQFKKMCAFYKKIVPIYQNVEIWRLKDQKPVVTFYGDHDQVVDDVPVWILPQDEWEVVFLDNGLKVKPEYQKTHKLPETSGQCGAPPAQPVKNDNSKNDKDKSASKSETRKQQTTAAPESREKKDKKMTAAPKIKETTKKMKMEKKEL